MAHWTQAEAVELCRRVEAIAPEFGCHVALTGGTLYKPGERKDCDILFYRIRQVKRIDVEGLMHALSDIGLEQTTDHGWVMKGLWVGNQGAVDMFFPERVGGPKAPEGYD